jgi:hypothetical protein
MKPSCSRDNFGYELAIILVDDVDCRERLCLNPARVLALMFLGINAWKVALEIKAFYLISLILIFLMGYFPSLCLGKIGRILLGFHLDQGLYLLSRQDYFLSLIELIKSHCHL